MKSNRAGHDLIFVSLENWDEIWRRNQFVCAQLARRHPDRKILFVAPPRDVSNQLRRGRLADLFSPATRIVPGFSNLTVTRPLKLVPNSFAVGRRWNEALARSQVRRAARQLQMENPLLWLNPHSAVHMAGEMHEAAVIYDITDDWTQLSQSETERQLTIAQDAALCRCADAVIVCSQCLFDLKQHRAERLHLIPNGVDAEHYRRVLDGTGALPEIAAPWSKPVLGYTGTIHSDRVDVDLIEAVARRFSSGTVALIGPMMLEGRDRDRLRACPNIVMPGPVPYAQIPDYMRAFDVAMTPHRMTPFTESLNPIKLWEYLAAGKPIVSTNVAGFRDYPEFVRVASDAASFCTAIEMALVEPATLRERRRAEARLHSWDRRVDQIEEVMQACVAKADGGETPRPAMARAL